MSRIQQRKVFRALTAHVVEKRFIAADEAPPDGWHDDQSAALAAYRAPAEALEAAPSIAEVAPGADKPRRGRPRKAA